MRYEKIKNAQELSDHGSRNARTKVLQLTDKVLQKLDQRVFLKDLIQVIRIVRMRIIADQPSPFIIIDQKSPGF